PARGWLVAAAPLPDGWPDGPETRAAGLAFAEGRDEVTGTLAEPTPASLAQAVRLADQSPASLAQLTGNFGFLRFRADGGVTAVRSCSGRVPFYWWSKGTRLVLATRLHYFPQLLPETFTLDPFVNAVWTAGHCLFPDGRTFLTGVRGVERGGFATFTAESTTPTTGTYWPPVPTDPLPSPSPEHPARLRQLLVRAVQRDLHPDGGSLLTLSGGLDSCCLAVAATRLAGRKIATWSLLPEDETHYANEKSFIAPLAELCGFERSWEVRLNLRTRAQLFAQAPPIVFQVVHPALCSLPQVQAEWPVRVLLGGEFADEVCGSFYTVPDWVRETSPLQLAASVVRGDSPWRDFGRWVKHRQLQFRRRPMMPLPRELPSLIHPRLRSEYAEWRDREQRRAAADDGPWRYFRLRLRHEEFPVMNWEGCSALGIRRAIPFMERKVMELTLQCHPSELIRPAHKKLLKAALLNDMPPHILNQPHKRNWGLKAKAEAMKLTWNQPLPEVMAPMVQPEWFPRPPPTVSYSEKSSLTQLATIAQSFTTVGK
ncbi:MAG: asparagine synthetase B family protein, partial [Mycobacteriaceae bacterium]|nr:asparagine synthetase B family protein [Mycobacteriaceae bacterium]